MSVCWKVKETIFEMKETPAGYAPDQFYLNHGEESEDLFYFLQQQQEQNSKCGMQNQFENYKFRRKAYFQKVFSEERINCVILSTYRLEIESIWIEFPQLFQVSCLIHTLILHGDRGRNFDFNKSVPVDSELKQDPSIKQEDEEYHISTPTKGSIPPPVNEIQIPNTVQIHEVVPQLLPTNPNKNRFSRRNQFAPGVHHPKYMLIFTDKGLHFIITTANYTGNRSLDASWVQFFPLRPNTLELDEYTNDFGIILKDFLEKQSFQIAKRDSIYCSQPVDILGFISQHTGYPDIEETYDFSIANVKLVSTVPSRKPAPHLSKADILALYSYYNIPITERAPLKCEKCIMEEKKLLSEEENHIHYGSLRIKHLLLNPQHRWTRPFSSRDTLYVQPTSIGQNLNNFFIEEFLSHLMPENNWEKNYVLADGIEECQQRSDNWRLIWPSEEYMKDIQKSTLERINANSVLFQQYLQQYQQRLQQQRQNQKGEHHSSEDLIHLDKDPFLSEYPQEILFFSPKTFAFMEPDIQSQIYEYSVNRSFIKLHKVPHIKTYTRLYAEHSAEEATNTTNKQQRQFSKCICHSIAWSWLTSACLSKGAQGEEKPATICKDCKHLRRGYWEYRNFELGVLFKSSKSRQYYALNEDCPIHCADLPTSFYQQQQQMSRQPLSRKEVFLPYPFDLKKSRPFCDESIRLARMPFFRPMNDIFKYLPTYTKDTVLKECAEIHHRNEFGRRVFRQQSFEEQKTIRPLTLQSPEKIYETENEGKSLFLMDINECKDDEEIVVMMEENYRTEEVPEEKGKLIAEKKLSFRNLVKATIPDSPHVNEEMQFKSITPPPSIPSSRKLVKPVVNGLENSNSQSKRKRVTRISQLFHSYCEDSSPDKDQNQGKTAQQMSLATAFKRSRTMPCVKSNSLDLFQSRQLPVMIDEVENHENRSNPSSQQDLDNISS